MLRRSSIVATAVVLALLAGACSDTKDPATSTTATGGDNPQEVVFDSGSLPDTIPADFPLPTGSSIGSTMVVTDTAFTEVVIRISATLGLTAEFFDQNLEQSGFEVVSSSGSDVEWTIEFVLDGAAGTIDITEPQSEISQAVVRFNVP